MAEEEHNRITGPEWNDLDGDWRYTIQDPKSGKPYILSVLPVEKKKNIVTVWQGGPDGPADNREAMSDPIDISQSKNLERFHESIVDIFDDRDMKWFFEVLEWLRMKHHKAVKQKNQEMFKEQLRERAERRIKGTDYFITDEGLAMKLGDELVPLVNIFARIVEELVVDTGEDTERERYFTIEARVADPENPDDRDNLDKFEIPAGQFDSMAWIRQHLGARAIVEPRAPKGNQHVRTAIQKDSDPKKVRAYGHTGWRKLEDGRWAYLHAGGAIVGFVGDCDGDGCPGCQDCQPFSGRVVLHGRPARRALPEPAKSEKLKDAVRATFRFWDLVDDPVAIPLDASAKRAVLGKVDASTYIVGPTGEGKTALGLVLLNYFGVGLTEKDGISYDSTENSIEEECYYLQDQIHLVDDFYDPAKHTAKMARVFRAAANNQGRSRMGRGDMPPRALVISTGEHFLAAGESLSSRVLVLHVPEGQGVDFSPGALINAVQDDARDGLYALAMSGFLGWLAPRYDELITNFEKRRRQTMRSVWSKEPHPRTPNIYADLTIGLRLWLDYARDIEAIDELEYDRHLVRGEEAIRAAVGAQPDYHELQDPVERFAVLLNQALSSGRAYLASPARAGRCPEDAGRWGWRKTGKTYKPQGVEIGWLLKDGLYLYPEGSLEVAKQLAASTGTPLDLSVQTMNQRLYDRGLLQSTDREKSRGLLTIRKNVNKESGTFLHLGVPFLEKGDNPNDPDNPEEGGE